MPTTLNYSRVSPSTCKRGGWALVVALAVWSSWVLMEYWRVPAPGMPAAAVTCVAFAGGAAVAAAGMRREERYWVVGFAAFLLNLMGAASSLLALVLHGLFHTPWGGGFKWG